MSHTVYYSYTGIYPNRAVVKCSEKRETWHKWVHKCWLGTTIAHEINQIWVSASAHVLYTHCTCSVGATAVYTHVPSHCLELCDKGFSAGVSQQFLRQVCNTVA